MRPRLSDFASILVAAVLSRLASAQGPLQLAVVAGPASAIAGSAFAPAMKVQVQDAAGQPVPIDGLWIRASLANDPTGSATLDGTTVQTTQGGVATFLDLSIEAAGAGYALAFTAPGTAGATSAPFDVMPAPPVGIRFRKHPKNTPAWNPLGPVVVDAIDAYGNVAPAPGVAVAVSLGSNPGANLLHASGSTGNPVLELVDATTPALLPPVTLAPPKQIAAMTYRPELGLVAAADLSDRLSLIDPATGSQLFLTGPGALPSSVKGLATEPASGALLAGLITAGTLWSLDLGGAPPSLLGPLTTANDLVLNLSGLATDPETGSIFGVAQLANASPDNRALMRVDPGSMRAGFVGFTGDRPAGLAFLPSGTLVAVTGDGGLAPEQLFRVDPATGAMTPLLPLGNGDSGEAIAAVPAQLRGTLVADLSSGSAIFGDLRVTAPAEGYTLRASAAGLGAAEGRPFAATAPDLSGIVQFASAAQSASEGAGTVAIALVVSPPQLHEVVAWVRLTGTATGAPFPGADYDLTSFVDVPVTIPAGSAQASLVLHLVDDAVHEPNETVIATLQRAALAQPGAAAVHTLTILDND